MTFSKQPYPKHLSPHVHKKVNHEIVSCLIKLTQSYSDDLRILSERRDRWRGRYEEMRGRYLASVDREEALRSENVRLRAEVDSWKVAAQESASDLRFEREYRGMR